MEQSPASDPQVTPRSRNGWAKLRHGHRALLLSVQMVRALEVQAALVAMELSISSSRAPWGEAALLVVTRA